MRSIAVTTLLLIATPQAADAALATIKATDQEHARLAGLELVQNYGETVLVSGSDQQLANARLRGLQLQIDPHGYVLTLPYAQPQDPQQRAPFSRLAGAELADGLALVQFQGPILPQWLDALRASGVEVVQYLHPYTYIVYQQGQSLSRAAQQQPQIRWIGSWPVSARIPPQIDTRAQQSGELRVLRYRGATIRDDALAAVDATLLSQADIDRSVQVQQVHIAANRVLELAAQPDVLSVQSMPDGGGARGEMSNQLLAGNVGGNSVPVPGYLNWLGTLAVNGANVRMANVDEGVFDNHPVLLARMASCSGLTCGGSGASSSHGTHTAAIMVGDASDGVTAINTDFLRGLGVAPSATLVEQVFGTFFLQPDGMLLLMKDSFNNGAVLSNNSWGTTGTPRGYDADTRQVDIGVRDTDNGTTGDQSLIYVLSINNGHGGVSTQGAPDEAKNSITVGATHAQLSQSNAATTNPHWQDLSSLSAHGPALDGRRIPHLVAPGDVVDSAVLAPQFYGLRSGTSMAAPHVSGAIALYIQGYQQRTGGRPSAALTKAALLAATRDLSGRKDASTPPATLGHRPDNKQGWGQLQLDRLLQQLDRSMSFDQQTIFTSSGQSWTVELEARSSEQPLQVFLAYTDAPGHGLCASSSCTTPAWNNDLNLEVIAGAITYKGNVFDAQGRAAAGGNADEKNNAEAVLFEAGRVSGVFTATVRAANISSDALPNSAGLLQQDFALFCSNCREAPIFRDGLE